MGHWGVEAGAATECACQRRQARPGVDALTGEGRQEEAASLGRAGPWADSSQLARWARSRRAKLLLRVTTRLLSIFPSPHPNPLAALLILLRLDACSGRDKLRALMGRKTTFSTLTTLFLLWRPIQPCARADDEALAGIARPLARAGIRARGSLALTISWSTGGSQSRIPNGPIWAMQPNQDAPHGMPRPLSRSPACASEQTRCLPTSSSRMGAVYRCRQPAQLSGFAAPLYTPLCSTLRILALLSPRGYAPAWH